MAHYVDVLRRVDRNRSGTSQVRHVVRYRLRRSLRQSRTALIAMVVVLALIGGAGLGALAMARETETSYATLLARSNPAQLNVTIYAPDVVDRLDRLAGVRHVEALLYSMDAFPISKSGVVEVPLGLSSGKVVPLGSIDGEYFNQDKVSVIAGRMANPHRKDEFVATAAAEKLMGWHVGQTIEMGFYNGAQLTGVTQSVLKHPLERVAEHLVGTVVFYEDLAQDEVDLLPTWILFTPVLTAPANTGSQYIDYALQLRPGVSVAQAEHEIIKALPRKVTYTVHTTLYEEGQVNSSVRPEALALGVFGVLVFLSALFIALQLVGRELRSKREQQEAMYALGADRLTLVVDAMAPFALAGFVGTVLALLVALAVSPLSPLGPVHVVLAGSLHLNAPIVLAGCAILLIGTIVGGAVLAYRSAPGRRVATSASSGGSRMARSAAIAGLGAPAVAGLHFAFDSGRGRGAVPVRSVLVGVALSVALLTTTLTFGAGLSTLVAHPRLYGWDWNYALGNTGGGIAPASMKVLSQSYSVAAWSPVIFADVQIDDQTIPAILQPSHAKVSPPLLSGHEVDAKNQIVLGEATLAALHKKVGESVTLSYGTKADAPDFLPPLRATIVGSATLPAIGMSQDLHTSMGTGAVIDDGVVTKGLHQAILENLMVSQVNMVLVRLRAGTTPAQGREVMNEAARAGNRAYEALPHGEGEGVSTTVLPVQYPGEIINYRAIGATPLYLSLGFALGVVVAFAFTIVSLVRRRRRDLALLKTLGFTRRQLSTCIAWQASATVLSGLVVGIPLGILLGRWLWDEFARQIYAVPLATIPSASLAVLAASALVIANVLAFFPGRSAARVAALALRSE
jgi:hypothetical protein